MPISGNIFKIYSVTEAGAGFPLGEAAYEKVIQPDFVFVGMSAYYDLSIILSRAVTMNPMGASGSGIPDGPNHTTSCGARGYYRNSTTGQWSCPFCTSIVPFDAPDGNIYAQHFSGIATGLDQGATDPIKFHISGYASGLNPNDPAEFPGTFAGPAPVITQIDNITWDDEEQEGKVTVSFTYAGPEEPTGFVTEWSDGIDWFPDDIVPFISGISNYTLISTIFTIPEEYIIRVTPYIVDPIENQIGTPSESFVVTVTEPTEPPITELPDISMTMSGGIDTGGAALITFHADPSGIYTLVPGKRNDTLYDRSVDPISEIDVAIPTPFIKTGFLS